LPEPECGDAVEADEDLVVVARAWGVAVPHLAVVGRARALVGVVVGVRSLGVDEAVADRRRPGREVGRRRVDINGVDRAVEEGLVNRQGQQVATGCIADRLRDRLAVESAAAALEIRGVLQERAWDLSDHRARAIAEFEGAVAVAHQRQVGRLDCQRERVDCRPLGQDEEALEAVGVGEHAQANAAGQEVGVVDEEPVLLDLGARAGTPGSRARGQAEADGMTAALEGQEAAKRIGGAQAELRWCISRGDRRAVG
jgi:hypothetical protein